jgi:hypothetical protein
MTLSWLKRQIRGSHTVEFVIILPIAINMLLFTLEVAMYFYRNAAVIDAMQYACREGALGHPDDTGVDDPPNIAEAAFKERIKPLDRGNIDCDVDYICDFDISEVIDTDADGMIVLKCRVDIEYDPVVMPLEEFWEEMTVLRGEHQSIFELQP